MKITRTRQTGGIVTALTAASLLLSACGSGAATAKTGPLDRDALDAATKAVSELTQPASDFAGPATAEPAPKDKTLVYVSCGATLDLCTNFGKSVQEAAGSIGWNVTIIDGKGTPTGWLDGMNKAISLKPDAIVAGIISPSAVPAPFKRAHELGIPVVSILGSGTPGPIPEANVFYNEDTPGGDVGKALAQMAIADSNGRARVVLLYDNAYAIARAKNDAMVKEIKACSSCELLDDISTQYGDLSTNGPGLMSGWLSKYGSDPFYVIAVGDGAFDSMVPVLKQRGISKDQVKLIAGDGLATAYQRIRDNDYQIATVPQPIDEMGYNAVDQVVRALNGEEPFDWAPATYLVTTDNVSLAGGDENQYIPQNDYAAKYQQLWSGGAS